MDKIKFRTALRGFNRQDVVYYIDMLNQQHATQINLLNSQLQAAKESTGNNAELLRQLEAINDRCAELEATLQQNAKAAETATNELEAYRRAERAERVATQKADQIYNRANAVLADATVKAEDASNSLADAAQLFSEQLAAYQASVQSARDALQEAVSALYAIRPADEAEDEEE